MRPFPKLVPGPVGRSVATPQAAARPGPARSPGLVLAAAGLAFLLAACGAASSERGVEATERTPEGLHEPIVGDPSRETIFGPGGISNLFTAERDGGPGSGGIGVNAFLWRASLDTFAFMPPFSADPLGGVIIYDWYSPPETPGERFKVAVYILDTRLRADAINVRVFRQVRGSDGEWHEAAVDPATSATLEDAILTRARQMRIAQLGQ